MVTPFSTVQKPLVQRKLREQLLGYKSFDSFSSLYVVKPKRQQSWSTAVNTKGDKRTQEDKPLCSFKHLPSALSLQTKLRRAAEQAACSTPQPTLPSITNVQNVSDLALNQTIIYTLRAAKAMGCMSYAFYAALKRLDHISNPVQLKKMLTAVNKDACTRCKSVLIPGVTCQLMQKSPSSTPQKRRFFKKASKCPCIFRKCFFCGYHQAIAWKRRETCIKKVPILKPSVEHIHFPLSNCMKNKRQKKILADTAFFQTFLIDNPQKKNTAQGQRRKKTCETLDCLNERCETSQHPSTYSPIKPQVQSICTTTHTPCVNEESSVVSVLNSFFSDYGN